MTALVNACHIIHLTILTTQKQEVGYVDTVWGGMMMHACAGGVCNEIKRV